MTIPKTLSALRLIRSEGVGPATYRRLVERFGTIEAALDAMPRMPKKLHPADSARIKTEHDALLKKGGHWLVAGEPDYPAAMLDLEDAPPVLSALGQRDLLKRPMLAMIGSRNASTNGRRLATQLARDLGAAGFVIVSGLARGIDAAAHETALDTGTIAVVANGVDVVYPPEHQKLYDALCAKGLVISENPLGAQPSASLFPRRNRIISGLCQGVIVVEAAAKSGSLITTRYALDQGREVFAVPGSPLDPRATGPNHLIKTGQAHLIERADDVLNVLGGLRTLGADALQPAFSFDDDEAVSVPAMGISATDDQARQAIWACISPNPTAIDQIVFSTGLATPRVLGILTEMELLGQVEKNPGNMVVRI